MPTILNFIRICCAVLAVAGIGVTVGNALIGHWGAVLTDVLGSGMYWVFFGITSYMKARLDERKRLSGFGGNY